MRWDVFISHASEDTQSVAKPLAELLRARGLRVWLDEYELKLGDNLSQEIDDGLANARYGVVILSKAFFQKRWPQKELAALVQRELKGKKIILPIWHEVDHQYVATFSEALADKLAISTAAGLDRVATTIIEVVISGSEVKVVLKQHPEVATTTVTPTWATLTGFVFGVSFLLIMLAIAVFVREPTGFQTQVFQVVLACAAAGVIAILPGALHVKVRRTIAASGAIGIFVLVYFFSTPLIRTLQVPAKNVASQNGSNEPKGGPDDSKMQITRQDKPPISASTIDNEIGFRLSKLLTRLEEMGDKTDETKLAQGLTKDNVRKTLREFATGTQFPPFNAEYAHESTLTVLAELRRQTHDAQQLNALDGVIADLSGIDTWMNLRDQSLANPKVTAGEVINSFVLPRWRNTSFYYLDCPSKEPFC